MRKGTILIVEDDHNIRNANRLALELEGYHVIEAETLSKGRRLVEELSPDLIIMDILLPDGNGLSYSEELRGRSGIRILFLSALNTKADLIAGLRAGGDDYITKPYDIDELILRVEALLRRGKLLGLEESLQSIGKLVLNHTSRRAFLNGEDLMLKPKEFSILLILINNYETTISAAELYEKVWGMDMAGDARTVKEHISRIRSKLGKTSGISILSERGRGYRLEFLKE